VISFVDTSVFIASFDASHIHHAQSTLLFDRLSPAETRCGAHTLAEVYAVLTRLPKPHRLRPDEALFFVDKGVERAEGVALTAGEYHATVRKAVADGVPGGNVCDALLLACARKANADVVYTWNLGHFRGASPDWAERIVGR
jgi:predicted nucleic acid-binding protein